MLGVLGQTLVTPLLVFEEILEDVEGILSLGMNTRLGVFHLFDQSDKQLAGIYLDLQSRIPNKMLGGITPKTL